MIYRTFQDKKLSMLGFGAMRLPTNPDGTIDEPQVREMTRMAIENGVNYFDTAYPYHGGESELVMGRVLADYPRERFYLATKYPGHQLRSTGYDPSEIFENQLRKCGVDYFDFYLLHNVYEKSMETYLDPQWGILPYFIEQKKRGRIRHLGFSSHGSLDNLRAFLDACGEDMEFCQIQLNYLDWTMQNAEAKYALLTERHIPVWVMEPVRGGKLANLSAENEAQLHAVRPDASSASWAFRFLHDLPNVSVILSGMSDLAQMRDNLRTFEAPDPLTSTEKEMLLRIAEEMKNAVPCTACRYCCDGCPVGLDIPELLSCYNEIRVAATMNLGMRMDMIPPDKKPDACIGCGNCAQICPQKIDIPTCMASLAELSKTLPSWAEICRQREAAEKKI